ncbi:GDP-mannose-dependent alpha-mannosyltransferase [Aureimonas endophytica]|uniref:GDP-mannose-dependent alpha-mannosyltransferase n=1 Tax=Aureimonas endophytica TaxID=2027858 RepID=A0A916ZX79_9HYPH|nr:glycosyltransferase family 1 protein [Aureimonas endophytica]GGE17690.1 GDP-mannose-dependent alpha-mannosyltransferase [Aureimonas endophytica]
MRILIATDAWKPQINGVVRVFDITADHLRAMGHEVAVIGPDSFALTLPAPSYPEVRLALPFGGRLGRLIEDFSPDAIHVPVEGPIGLAARRWCLKRGLPFTTSFHTRFGDYFETRLGIDARHFYRMQRWFHDAGAGFMVQTDSLERQLGAYGFRRIRRWGRAVDTERFRPWREAPGFDPDFLGLPRPIFAYVGRVAREKNLEAFFRLDLPGTKLVVGDGPSLAEYRAAWPKVHFTGYRHGDDLARHFAAADVFVLPSRFETFGLVVLEALACGTPVAALPVPGPLDIVGAAPEVASLSEDLAQAAEDALALDRTACRRFAERFSWAECTRQFSANLVRIA